MEHTHFVSVAGLVRNSRGHLLLVNSPRRRWEYPGGMEVAWFSPEDALEAVTFPLTRHRLSNMLGAAGKMYCFSFRRDHFQVTDELLLPIAK